MKKILVPTDFSKRAEEALKFAIQFAAKVNGKITLMHVLDFPSGSFNTTGEMNSNSSDIVFRAEFIKGVHSRLEQIKSSLDVEVHGKIKYGNPYVSISKEIAEEEVDYIIMGSNGASGLKEVFIGSVAEKVIRNADCPVIVVKGPANLENFKSIVFASDLSEEQDFIAYRAKDIQELLDVNMHLITVKTPHNMRREFDTLEKMKDFAKRNFLERYSVSTVDADYSEDGIVDYAEEIGAGMILMGTHGRTGLAHIFGGSRAEDVANESNIPVMTFKINL